MSKEIEQKLMEQASNILEAITNAVGQAKELAIEQLPDIAYQYILYNRAYYSIIFIVFTIILAISTILIYKKEQKCSIWDSGYYWFLGSIITIVPSIIALMLNFKQLLLVWLAPNIFLIEQLVNLIKK